MNPLEWTVWVDRAEFDAAQSGDLAAATRLGEKLDGVVLYDHAVGGTEGEIAVTLREFLSVFGIVNSVTLHKAIA